MGSLEWKLGHAGSVILQGDCVETILAQLDTAGKMQAATANSSANPTENQERTPHGPPPAATSDATGCPLSQPGSTIGMTLPRTDAR